MRRTPGPRDPRGPWWRENRAFAVGGLVLVLLVGGLIAFFALRGEEDDAAAAAVPAVVGMQESEARSLLEQDGYDVDVTREPRSEPEGEVVAQEPGGGSQLPEGGTVELTVSAGETQTETVTETETQPAEPETVTVPNVVGDDQVAAGREIEAENLKADSYPVPSSEAAGTVVVQNPEGGAEAQTGDTVRLNVSVGEGERASRTVPDVTGPRESNARAIARRNRFTVRTVDRDAPSADEVGEVIEQQPAAGATAPEFSQITIYVGR